MFDLAITSIRLELSKMTKKKQTETCSKEKIKFYSAELP